MDANYSTLVPAMPKARSQVRLPCGPTSEGSRPAAPARTGAQPAHPQRAPARARRATPPVLTARPQTRAGGGACGHSAVDSAARGCGPPVHGRGQRGRDDQRRRAQARPRRRERRARGAGASPEAAALGPTRAQRTPLARAPTPTRTSAALHAALHTPRHGTRRVGAAAALPSRAAARAARLWPNCRAAPNHAREDACFCFS